MSAVLDIGSIVEAGQAFDPKRRGVMSDLKQAVDSLFDALEAAQVDYVLVGGVAVLSYVHGRNTQDIDLIVSPASLGALEWNAEAKDADFGVATFAGVHVDLLLRSNAFFDEVAREHTTTADFGARRVRVATREGLVLLKLHALPDLYRRGDLARAALFETDILMLHQGVALDDDKMLTILARHREDHDVVELRRILDEQRSRKRFGA